MDSCRQRLMDDRGLKFFALLVNAVELVSDEAAIVWFALNAQKEARHCWCVSHYRSSRDRPAAVMRASPLVDGVSRSVVAIVAEAMNRGALRRGGSCEPPDIGFYKLGEWPMSGVFCGRFG